MASSSLAYKAEPAVFPLDIQLLQGGAVKSHHQLHQAKLAAQALMAQYQENTPLLHWPQTTRDMKKIEDHAAWICEESDRLVLVGIGGSCLGAKALASIADHSDPLRFDIMDNPDPTSVTAMLEQCNPLRTSWLFISKSGGTLETISQILIILNWLEERIGEKNIASRCIAIAGSEDSPLNKLATHYRIPVLRHEEVGGRWAGLSAIGLLPAACCGVDIIGCRHGAEAMLQHTLEADIADNQPLQGALFAISHYRQSRPIHVVMPYTDQLDISAWYGQLVSESLGKDGKGITPLAARGAVDQHSMLQLMLGGPDDKFFTLITTEHGGKEPHIPAHLAKLCGLDYLANQPIGNILMAFQEGTIGSIKASGRPIRTIHLPKIDAFYMGALLMYFMLETLYMAELLKVDPFTQPAVEDSKLRAKLILRNETASFLAKGAIKAAG